MYASIEEIRDYLGEGQLEDISEPTLQTLICAAAEMIDGYCKKTFDELQVPAIVKSVCMDLVKVLITDITKQSESIGSGDYSYTQNNTAYDQVLARLKYLVIDGEVLYEQGKRVKVRLV